MMKLSDLLMELLEIENQEKALAARRQQIMVLLRQISDEQKKTQIAELTKRAELQKPIESTTKKEGDK